jgi:LPXTG-motif cell wall-anchored protein
MELAISTELKESAITLDDLALEDVVTPTLVDGGWLQGAGGRLPVVVRLTAYGQTGDVVRQATPPSNAEAIASTTVTVSAPRTGHDAPAMRIPLADFKRFDGGAVQACILDADQPAEYRGYVLETCDDYGAAGEIFSFTTPAVTTKAQSSGSLGELISDTAIVSNADLPAGSTIGATAYLRPVAGHLKYDSSWQPVLDANGDPVVWTQDEIDALSPEALCEVQPVGRTARVPATARGEYQLPGIRAGSEGSGVDWVEDTEIQDPETGDPVEWSRGTCGIVEEYTDLPAPKVSTQVHLPEAGLADRNFDTLIVEDLQTVSSDSLYEYEAIVDAYYTADENDQPRCDASELVWTSRPLAVTGAGRFDTESYRVGDVVPKGTTGGRLDHVEQLIRVEKSTGGREVIAVGACGAASESTIIKEKAPALPITGGQSTALAALAGVVLILLGGAAAVVQHRRRLKLSAQVRECGDEVLR